VWRQVLRDFVGVMARERTGLRTLANFLDSMIEKLVDEDFVRDVLDDAADEWLASGRGLWQGALRKVCQGAGSRRKLPYLRASACTAAAPANGMTWTVVLSATTWTQYQVNRSRVTAADKMLPSFPPRWSRQETQAQVDAIVALAGWSLPATSDAGGWLGLPPNMRGNCWLACPDIEASGGAATRDVDASAEWVCEALGIAPGDSVWRVRYSFDALSQASTRPNAADLGTEWFRVLGQSSRARKYAEVGWGATVHLSAERLRSADDCGMPERVTPPIDIAQLATLRIEVLEPRRSQREPLDEVRFESNLLRLRSEADIENGILALWPGVAA
jgi:hypothetical protein